MRFHDRSHQDGFRHRSRSSRCQRKLSVLGVPNLLRNSFSEEHDTIHKLRSKSRNGTEHCVQLTITQLHDASEGCFLMTSVHAPFVRAEPFFTAPGKHARHETNKESTGITGKLLRPQLFTLLILHLAPEDGEIGCTRERSRQSQSLRLLSHSNFHLRSHCCTGLSCCSLHMSPPARIDVDE
jgi:hypothetical protein